MPVNTITQPVWEIAWNLPIPHYFFMTGASAGALFLFILYYLFRIEKLKPVAGLGLLVAFTLDLAAPLNLISDLGMNARFVEMMYRFNPTAPLSYGASLLLMFIALLAAMVYLYFRDTLFAMASKSEGSKLKFYKFLAGDESYSEERKAKDAKILRILTMISIPTALAVHGYTGFLLGIIKSRPLWNSSLIPILFLVSAVISGIALVALLAALLSKLELQGEILNAELRSLLGKLMGAFIIADLVIKFMWYIIDIVALPGLSEHVSRHLFVESWFSTFGIELLLGALVPLYLLWSPNMKNKIGAFLTASALALIAIWIFRFSMVIGGQEISKWGSGNYHYLIPFWGKDGLIQVIGNVAFWIFLFTLFTWFIPWEKKSEETL